MMANIYWEGTFLVDTKTTKNIPLMISIAANTKDFLKTFLKI